MKEAHRGRSRGTKHSAPPRSTALLGQQPQNLKGAGDDDYAAPRPKGSLRSTILRRADTVHRVGQLGADSERSIYGGLVAPGMARPPRAVGSRGVPDELLQRILWAAPAKHRPLGVGAHRHLRARV